MIVDIIQNSPRISIVVIAALVSLFISAINYFVLDKNKLRESRKRQKELQVQMKQYKNDPSKQMELSKEMVNHSMEQFRHSMKPMIITLIPVLVVFWWIKGVFIETTLAGSWFWWYLVSAIIFSFAFRKVFKLP